MRKVIYPAILAEHVEEFCKKVDASSQFAEGVQIDVMDGKFVPAKTFQQVERIAACKPGSLFFELHLMVENPADYIRTWEKVADSYILHIEAVPDPRPNIAQIRQQRKEVGIALNPETPLEAIEPYVRDIDMVLIMAVNPGKGGQAYVKAVNEKIRFLRAQFPELPIEVDGGVNLETIHDADVAGANIFVAGTAIFNQYGKTPKEAFLELQSLLHS